MSSRKYENLAYRDDFETLHDGDVIIGMPRADNPLHRKPIELHYYHGYFFDEDLGLPDPAYYIGDVRRFLVGFELKFNELNGE